MEPTMYLRFTIGEDGKRILEQWWHYATNDYSGEWIAIDFNPTGSDEPPKGWLP